MTKLSAHNRLRDYFYDDCSEQDQAEIIEWLSSNSDSEEVDDIFLALLDEVRVENPAMAQEAFENFCRRIGRPVSVPVPVHARRFRSVVRWTRRIAAILAVPLVAALSVMYFHAKSNGTPEWEEQTVPLGQRSELLLSDGTLLRLNSGTRVTYPVNFGGKHRKIFVNGEVYAEVARDESRPFIISAGDVQVQVLGTTFNMRAYGTDSSVELALVEGSVSFDVHSEKCNRQVVMLGNDIVRYDRRTGELDVSTFQSLDYKPRATGRFLLFQRVA